MLGEFSHIAVRVNRNGRRGLPGNLSMTGGIAGQNGKAGEQVTCRGTATLRYSSTPMGLVIPVDLDISSQAQAHSSEFRSR